MTRTESNISSCWLFRLNVKWADISYKIKQKWSLSEQEGQKLNKGILDASVNIVDRWAKTFLKHCTQDEEFTKQLQQGKGTVQKGNANPPG